MIKRRFYRAEHADKDNKSTDSSSSSSDSDVEVRSSDDSENEQPEPGSNFEPDDDDDSSVGGFSTLRTQQLPSSSSGYESEDSSANEIDADLAGLPENDDESDSEKDGDQRIESLISRKPKDEIKETRARDHSTIENLPSCILKCKSVYKCRLCPKIVCLNEESLKAHLKSKRHSRSEKLLNDGRLKRILNSDGEEEVITDDDGETHAERHARILAMAQDTSKKKGKGRQRQRLRLKRKKQRNTSNIQNSGEKTQNRAKRRRKDGD